MGLNSEIIIGDFRVKLLDTAIYISKNRKTNVDRPQSVDDYFDFLKTTIICSNKVSHLVLDGAYIISSQYRLVINDMYIFLGKINIDDWSNCKMNTLDFKGKWNLIRAIDYFFSLNPLW